MDLSVCKEGRKSSVSSGLTNTLLFPDSLLSAVDIPVPVLLFPCTAGVISLSFPS